MRNHRRLRAEGTRNRFLRTGRLPTYSFSAATASGAANINAAHRFCGIRCKGHSGKTINRKGQRKFQRVFFMMGSPPLKDKMKSSNPYFPGRGNHRVVQPDNRHGIVVAQSETGIHPSSRHQCNARNCTGGARMTGPTPFCSPFNAGRITCGSGHTSNSPCSRYRRRVPVRKHAPGSSDRSGHKGTNRAEDDHTSHDSSQTGQTKTRTTLHASPYRRSAHGAASTPD